MSDVRTRARHPTSAAGPEPVRPFWDGVSRGSEVVALSVALTLTAATVEITLAGHLHLFFDLCFVAVCIAAALLVRPRDFFTVGVLPPLLMFGTMVLVALNGPASSPPDTTASSRRSSRGSPTTASPSSSGTPCA